MGHRWRARMASVAHLLCSARAESVLPSMNAAHTDTTGSASPLPVHTITSRQNPLVARFLAVARSGRVNRQHILLDGARLIDDARKAGVTPEVAVFSARGLGRHDQVLTNLARTLKALGVDVLVASESVLAAMSPVRSPSGVVALAHHRPPALDRVFTGPGLVMAPVGVQDPGNVGAIIRAADAGEASGLIVTGGSADPFGWRALRGAMASTFRLPVAEVDNVRIAVNAARVHGARVLAAVPRGGTPFDRVDLTGRTLVLLGGEGSGLDHDIVSLADARISVPMRRSVDSLNTAVAAALIVYESRRQKQRPSLHSSRTARASVGVRRRGRRRNGDP